MIAYDKHGTVFALREGAELLVHDGESEGPLWRKMLDAQIVGLGADKDLIGAITATGTVTWFGARTGELVTTGKVEGKVEHATFIAAKKCIAATAGQIVAIDKDGTTTLAEHGAKALATRPDGGVCVAHADELVQIVDGARLTTPYARNVGAICWHPAGFWLVGAEAKVERWSGTAPLSHVTQVPDGKHIQHLAATDRAFAMSWDDHDVAELAWPSKETLGSLFYPERKVEGLAFGPWPWLGVALDLGDANKHNLDKPNGCNRSDTHEGRDHHSWLVRVGGGEKDDDKRSAPASKPAAPVASAKPGSSLLGYVIIGAIGILVWLIVK